MWRRVFHLRRSTVDTRNHGHERRRLARGFGAACSRAIGITGRCKQRGKGDAERTNHHWSTRPGARRLPNGRRKPDARNCAGKSSPNTMARTRSGQCRRRKHSGLERMRSAQSSRRERSPLVLQIVFRCRRGTTSGSRRAKPSPRSPTRTIRAGKLQRRRCCRTATDDRGRFYRAG